MARRSVLSSFREQQETGEESAPKPAVPAPSEPSALKPGRHAKLHIGGYFDPNDETVIAFQKLKIDLRKSQQEMLHEALRDFVDRQKVALALR